ncbi:MAG: hypothetical protein GY722_05640 [bacterium]|nr:hypothetical protein [bacterium]
MKRYVPLFAVLVLVLSACTIRIDLVVNVNEDESGTFDLFVGFDEDLRQLMEQGGGGDLDITEQFSDAPDNWTVEEVSEGGFEGVRISTDFESFDDLEVKLAELSDDGGGGLGSDMLSDFELTHEEDEYRFRADVSGVDEGLTEAVGDSGGDMLSGFDASLMEDLFEIRFRLTLPGTIGDNNADGVNGNTLTWNLDVGADGDELYASSTAGGGSSMMLIGGAAVAAVALVGVGVAASRRRKTNAAVDAVTNSPI